MGSKHLTVGERENAQVEVPQLKAQIKSLVAERQKLNHLSHLKKQDKLNIDITRIT